MSNDAPPTCGVLADEHAVLLAFRMIMSNKALWSWLEGLDPGTGAASALAEGYRNHRLSSECSLSNTTRESRNVTGRLRGERA
jgi:hypothetical protein